MSSSGVELTDAAVQQCARYWELLCQWRQAVNLTGCRSEEEFARTLVAGALAPLSLGLTPPDTGPIVDVGSGAGSPGLPLAFLWPDREFVLVEAHQRKASFLRHVVGELNLSHVRVVDERAETLGHDSTWRERFGLALSRAAAVPPLACEWCLPLVLAGGEVWLYVSEVDARLVSQSAEALTPLGAGGVHVYEAQAVPDTPWLVRIVKQSACAPEYPRPIKRARRGPLFRSP